MSKEMTNLERARQTLRLEGQAVLSLADGVGGPFARAADALYACKGKVVLTGIGKAGIVAQKISATLASTGTPSIFLHPVEALHGDLGRLQRQDVAIALSHSGQTEEILRLMDHIKARGAKLIAFTGDAGSPLGRYADITVSYGPMAEACPHGLAPTVSTTCMLALGDALALQVMSMRDFTPEDFAVFHPGGSLGRKLLKVDSVMTSRGERLSVARDSLPLSEALREAEKTPRRTGVMLLTDDKGRLSGIVTDADLRRAVLARGPEIMDRPASEIMTRKPKCIRSDQLASEALAIFNRFRIDELPVVDEAHRPLGVIDVQDVLGLKTMPEAQD